MEHQRWANQIEQKLKCLRTGRLSVYHYHARRSAGSSLREVMIGAAKDFHVKYFETEGSVLESAYIESPELFSVTSMRDPISRIQSLYWSEHISWCDGVLKQPEKCKTFSEWVKAWSDGSHWKIDFVNANPSSSYIEIQNYYVKSLIGYKYDSPSKIRLGQLTEADYELAKTRLKQFDLVFLQHWMYDDTQIGAMNAVFPPEKHRTIATTHKAKGDWLVT